MRSILPIRPDSHFQLLLGIARRKQNTRAAKVRRQWLSVTNRFGSDAPGFVLDCSVTGSGWPGRSSFKQTPDCPPPFDSTLVFPHLILLIGLIGRATRTTRTYSPA